MAWNAKDVAYVGKRLEQDVRSRAAGHDVHFRAGIDLGEFGQQRRQGQRIAEGMHAAANQDPVDARARQPCAAHAARAKHATHHACGDAAADILDAGREIQGGS